MNIDENNTGAKAGLAKGANREAASKQKMQIIMLSGLAVLLIAVLFMQFSGSEPEFEAAALMDIDLEDLENDIEDGEADFSEPMVAKDNPVLLQTSEDDALLRNAFSNFWDNASADEGPVVELTPPSAKLSGTMPGAQRGIAIIDGRISFVGDMVDGWEISEILSRQVVLRGPTGATAVIDMPVIFGRVTVPDSLDIPPDPSGEPGEDAPSEDGSYEPVGG